MNAIRKTFLYGNQEVTMETGRIARQATGSVLITMGKTSVLTTVVMGKNENDNFFSAHC